MRKTIVLILAFIMLLTLCSCGGKAPSAQQPEDDSTKEPTLSAEEQAKLAEAQKMYADGMEMSESIILPLIDEYISDFLFSHFDYTDNIFRCYFESSAFSSLSDEKKLLTLSWAADVEDAAAAVFKIESEYFPDLEAFETYVISNSHIYRAEIISNGYALLSYSNDNSGQASFETLKELDADFVEKHQDAYIESISKPSSSGNNSSSSNGKCYWCNGTGSVRYNYGSSDLEAILSGHDPYTYGTCASCGGTGKAK